MSLLKRHKIQLTKSNIESMLDYAILPEHANVNDIQYFFKRWIGWKAVIVVERNETIDDSAELKELFDEFCRAFNRSFEEQYLALQEEYNPIENYDRYEETVTTTKDTYGKQKITIDSVNGKQKSTSDTLNYGSAFNGGVNYGNNGKNTITTNSDAFTDTNTSNTDEHIDNGESKVISRIHGNIGVTESSRMLENKLLFEREFRALELWFVNQFIHDHCVID